MPHQDRGFRYLAADHCAEEPLHVDCNLSQLRHLRDCLSGAVGVTAEQCVKVSADQLLAELCGRTELAAKLQILRGTVLDSLAKQVHITSALSRKNPCFGTCERSFAGSSGWYRDIRNRWSQIRFNCFRLTHVTATSLKIRRGLIGAGTDDWPNHSGNWVTIG